MNCKSTVDESDTEKTPLRNMLHIENEYETPFESNYFQNNNYQFQNSDNTQNIINYTEQALKGS